jgi:DNA repair protein RadC
MFKTLKLFDIELKDRPRERIKRIGGNYLTDAELLAIVLRSGGIGIAVTELSSLLIKEFGSLGGVLKADFQKLLRFPNLGEAKVSSIKAIHEICLRIQFPTVATTFKVKEPKDVVRLLKKDFFDKDKEYLYLLSLNTRLKLISKDLISIGTVNETLIHAREVFKKAVMCNAVSVILAHNHPSNDPTPSDADITLTKEISEAGKILGIALLDHIIITNDSYFSIKSLQTSL